ncbi:hypothetical protein PENTCL1PPCAC_15609, partial [Pristionchus entomophagus]
QWMIVTNFFYRFRMFEGCYRSNKFFANEPKLFVSYATYLTVPFDEKFLESAPHGADIAGAVEFHRICNLTNNMSKAREIIERLNLNEEEFLAVVLLMFWTTEELSVSDEVNPLGGRYRGDILKELYSYYREEMGLDDYAIRLGELMMLMQVFETSTEFNEHFEILRFFNIMTDDNFVYRLQKDLTIS